MNELGNSVPSSRADFSFRTLSISLFRSFTASRSTARPFSICWYFFHSYGTKEKKKIRQESSERTENRMHRKESRRRGVRLPSRSRDWGRRRWRQRGAGFPARSRSPPSRPPFWRDLWGGWGLGFVRRAEGVHLPMPREGRRWESESGTGIDCLVRGTCGSDKRRGGGFF